MNAIKIALVLVLWWAAPAIASAQYRPAPYPDWVPAGPSGPLGGFRQEQADREFWEAWSAQYRLDEAQLAYELRKLRSAEAADRELARARRREQARLDNLAKAVQRTQQQEDRARHLYDAIQTGVVRWPRVFLTRASRVQLDEAALILSHRQPLSGQRQERLLEIAAELRREIKQARDEYSHGQRTEAQQVVEALEDLARQGGQPRLARR